MDINPFFGLKTDLKKKGVKFRKISVMHTTNRQSFKNVKEKKTTDIQMLQVG